MSISFKVDPSRIFVLSDDRFARLCNSLIRVEAERAGIRQDLVDTTTRIKAPDGGIDARISPEETLLTGRWIPDGGSAWQFKSGRCPSTASLKTGEFSKTEVIAAVDRGDYYCFLSGDSVTSQKKNGIRRAIEQIYSERGRPHTYRMYSADEIAEWVSEHPAVAVRFFRVPIVGWQIFEQWSGASRFQNPFIYDEQRRELVHEIRTGVKQGQRVLRLLGHAGVGKTRTVLEAINEDGLRERVLYLADAAFLNPDLFWYFQQENPHGSGVLVVDECTSEQFLRLRDLANTLPQGFAVIAVGPIQYGTTSGALALGSLGVNELAEVLRTFAAELPEAVRKAIAMRCGGSPKFVVDYGRQIAQAGGQYDRWEEIEKTVDVVEYLNKRVFPMDGADAQVRLMRGLSLFTQIGWYDDVQNEGQLVARFCRLDWNDARDAASSLIPIG